MSDKSALDAARMIVRADDDGDVRRYRVLAYVWAEPMARALLAMAEERNELRNQLVQLADAVALEVDNGDSGSGYLLARLGDTRNLLKKTREEPSNG